MSEPIVLLRDFIAAFDASPLATWGVAAPWELTSNAAAVVRQLLDNCDGNEFSIDNEVAIHRTATVESGAVLKGPLIVGAHSFIAASAYLRHGNWIAERCSLGPGAELKSSFVFARSKLAHFNFVGDSILGEDVNLEAGSIICNYRNERADKEILVRLGKELRQTGCQKFGAVVGDYARIGANAVLAPGVLLQRGAAVLRASLRDDEL